MAEPTWLEHRLPTLLITPHLLLAGLLAQCLLLGLLLAWRRRLARRHAALLAALAERERITASAHDSLLQGMQGILLSIHSVGQRLPATSAERAAIEHILDQGDAALAEGRQQWLELSAAQVFPDEAKQ